MKSNKKNSHKKKSKNLIILNNIIKKAIFDNKQIKQVTKRGQYFFIECDDEVISLDGLSASKASYFIKKGILDRIILLIKAIKNKFLATLNQYSRFREPGFLFIINKAILGSSKKTKIIQIGSDDGNEIEEILLNFSQTVESYDLYEPIEEHLSFVEKKLDRFSLDKRFYLSAVSNYTSKESFYIDKGRPNLSGFQENTESSNKKITVDVESIQNILKEHLGSNYPILLLMDIEGHEVKILKGLIEFLKISPNISISICMELHPTKYIKKYDMRECLNILMKEFNFQLKLVESAGKVIPKEFELNRLKPIFSSRDRGVYKVNNEEFLIRLSSAPYLEEVNYYPYVNLKAIRSILLSNCL
tara:strand:+ start:3747 stop:4823 length:1077 start_codon:yes stop_codon:yes gene_type:complete